LKECNGNKVIFIKT